jgi:two-component system sensor histidine kinase RpfC
VTDTGIGIGQDQLSAIFDSFWQADSSSTRRYGGTGLGTTIARDLTRLMGGVIGVESEEGKGSHFWIKVPLIDSAVCQAPQAPAQLQGRRALVWESNPSSARALESACLAGDMDYELVTDTEARDGLGKLPGEADILLVSEPPLGKDMRELASMLRDQLRPDIPILYLHNPRRKVVVPEGNAAMLTKPFNMVSLWRTMVALIEPALAESETASIAERQVVQPERRGHVLVAEDDSINAKLIQALLERAGHRVTLVHDGEAALREALAGEFDLAFIDLRMPKMDGLDFTLAYREQESPAERLPIVALTADAAEEALPNCLVAGMDKFLTKPVNPQVLDDVLREYGVG